MFDAKFFAKDVVGKMPTEVGQVVKIKTFMGMKNVEFIVTEICGGMFFAGMK